MPEHDIKKALGEIAKTLMEESVQLDPEAARILYEGTLDGSLYSEFLGEDNTENCPICHAETHINPGPWCKVRNIIKERILTPQEIWELVDELEKGPGSKKFEELNYLRDKIEDLSDRLERIERIKVA